MPKLFPHVVTLGSDKYICMLPDVYENGTLYSIGSALNISKLTGDAPAGSERMEVSEGLKNGKLIRVRVSYVTGTGTSAKSRSSRIVCPIDQGKTAIASLPGKKYNGVDVTSAGIPRRRRLG